MVAACLGAWSGANAQVATAPEPGLLQIPAETGVSVRLDDSPPVAAEEPHGLLLRDLAPGPHRLLATREGFAPQHALAWVEPGRVSLHALRPWVPAQRPRRPTGALWIDTFPVDATVEVKSLEWPKVQKAAEPFLAPQVPAGQHRLTVCNDYKCLDHRVHVRAGGVTALLVDLDSGEITDVGRAEVARDREARARCAERAEPEACKSACNRALALEPERPPSWCEALLSGPDLSAPTRPMGGAAAIAVSAPLPTAEPTCRPSPGEAPGFVTISAKRPLELLLDDTSLGRTPLTRLELPAGCVELRATNPELGIDRKVQLDVVSGRVSSYRLAL